LVGDLAGVALTAAFGVAGFTGEAFFLGLTVFLEVAALGAAAVVAFAAGAASFLAFFTGTYTKECDINHRF